MIADDPEALRNLGLTISHGFLSFGFGRWFGDPRSLGNDILRAKRPGLHSWVTSMSWRNFTVLPGYYLYKQVCRSGQRGMAVTRVASADSEVGLIGFAGNGTGHADAFVVLNLSECDKRLKVRVAGGEAASFDARRTSSSESYVAAGDFAVKGKAIDHVAPGRSVTAFFAV